MKNLKRFALVALMLMSTVVLSAKDAKVNNITNFRAVNETEISLNERVNNQKFFGDPIINIDIFIDDNKIDFEIYDKIKIDDTYYLVGKSRKNSILNIIEVKKDSMTMVFNKRALEIQKTRFSGDFEQFIENI
jgi:hypothetical protein